MRDALRNMQWIRDITMAPSMVGLVQYAELWDKVQGVGLLPKTPDRFVWKWTASGGVLFGLGISGLLPWVDQASGRKGAVEDGGAARGKIFLLA